MSGPLFRIEGLVLDRGSFRMVAERLELPAGRPTLVLGPTASGKSTFLAALARLETPWLAAPGGPRPRGRILFDPGDGERVDLLALSERELNARGIRGARIGLVPQGNGLFAGLSVTENVAWPLRRRGLPRREAERRAREALERTGGPPADRPVPHLSGGEAKRLAVARALAHEPRAILLDEPFTGLDPESAEAMIALAKGLAPEVTPVVVTHRERAVRALAGHVVLLRDGRVDWAGEAEEAGDRIDRFLSRVREEYVT